MSTTPYSVSNCTLANGQLAQSIVFGPQNHVIVLGPGAIVRCPGCTLCVNERILSSAISVPMPTPVDGSVDLSRTVLPIMTNQTLMSPSLHSTAALLHASVWAQSVLLQQQVQQQHILQQQQQQQPQQEQHDQQVKQLVVPSLSDSPQAVKSSQPSAIDKFSGKFGKEKLALLRLQRAEICSIPRRARTEDEKEELLKMFQCSKLSLRKFCKAHHLAPQTLKQWLEVHDTPAIAVSEKSSVDG
jgi:hypothetical protein